MAEEWQAIDWMKAVNGLTRRLHWLLPGFEKDELFSVSLLSIVEASRLYDRSHGTTIETFLYKKGLYRAFDNLRTDKLLQRRDSAVKKPRFVQLSSIVSIAANEEPLPTSCREYLGPLPQSLRGICLLYYDDNLSTAEIGERLGITANNVGQKLFTARRILKETQFASVEICQ